MATYSIRENAKQSIKPYSSTYLIVWLVIGVVLLVVSAAIAHTHQLHGWQARVFYDFNNASNRFKTVALWITEGLGAGYAIAACVLIPLVMKKYRLAWRFFVTVGGAFVANYIVKELIKEPRPITMLIGHLQQRAAETGPSFPSGHEAAATALALTLWFLLPAKWRWVSIVWIGVVAWSRLYLGVHAPVDVIGGFAIGLMAVCVIRLLPNVIAKPLRLDEVTD